MHISTKDLVYEHLPHSALFTLSLFPIFPYIAYLAILDTKVCIHTICTAAIEVAPFAAVSGILVATAFSAPLPQLLLSRILFSLDILFFSRLEAHIRSKGYM